MSKQLYGRSYHLARYKLLWLKCIEIRQHYTTPRAAHLPQPTLVGLMGTCKGSCYFVDFASMIESQGGTNALTAARGSYPVQNIITLP